MGETERLARFVSELKFEDLPPYVIEKTKSLILDQLGCEIAFASLPWNQLIHEYVREKRGAKKSTVLFYGTKTAPEDAAFVNATFGHGFEMDDTELYSVTHPGSVVIPSALSVGEMIKANGKIFLVSIVAGYEVMIRVGMAARLMINRAFHNTCVLGPLGASVAAAKIMGLGFEKILNAIGIAASKSSGISEWGISGGSVKRLHAGFAAESGVKAAILAEKGITAPPTVLEGRRGFLQAFADEYFLEEITKDLGKEFRILRTGNKPYCCCAAQHSEIDALCLLINEYNLKREEIEEIVVRKKARDIGAIGGIIEPTDITSAQFSGRFGLALRLIKGGNGFRDYSEENIKNPEILRMARKIKYEVDEKLEGLPPDSAPAKVEILLKDGSKIEKEVVYAKGTLQNPMSVNEIKDKFRDLSLQVVPKYQTEKIIGTIDKLEDLQDLSKLTPLLVKKNGGAKYGT